jgi:hypothetical protein
MADCSDGYVFGLLVSSHDLQTDLIHSHHVSLVKVTHHVWVASCMHGFVRPVLSQQPTSSKYIVQCCPNLKLRKHPYSSQMSKIPTYTQSTLNVLFDYKHTIHINRYLSKTFENIIFLLGFICIQKIVFLDHTMSKSSLILWTGGNGQNNYRQSHTKNVLHIILYFIMCMN